MTTPSPTQRPSIAAPTELSRNPTKTTEKLEGKPEDRVEDQESRNQRWNVPAFWDIQQNGRWGWSFSDPEIPLDVIRRLIRRLASRGVSRFCPTFITASSEFLARALERVAEGVAVEPWLSERVAGFHLEGPMISPRDGYRGAHPLEAVRALSLTEFDRLQECAGGRIVLVTLAPEWPEALETIAGLKERGVVVALGHTAADGERIAQAVEAGATLSTHLGNGLAAELPRHPNPIWVQGAEDRLTASLIADGLHLDDATLACLWRIKGPNRTILVSDDSPLAGCAPGRYGPWWVDEQGTVRVAGTSYLAGANLDLMEAVNHLIRVAGATLEQALSCVTTNPARLLGQAVDPGDRVELGFDDRDGRWRVLSGEIGGRRFRHLAPGGRPDAATAWEDESEVIWE